uniref:ANK_REP_REGION domain-containing protein n=1 Tax=Nippostrongylus brasiliensis TaxID=27835 RepID=A0A0N4Y387_NIPBR
MKLKALLANKKLDPNEKNLSEWTPLLYAAYLGHHNVCSVLIEAGAKTDDCNTKGQTPLMMAASCGNLQGGDPFLKNNRGEDCQTIAGDDSKIHQIITEHIQRRAATAYSSELLEEMNLARLVDKFKTENIDLNLFFDLTEKFLVFFPCPQGFLAALIKDFEEMGIAYGPKKRMLTVIDRYRKTGQISCEPIEVEVVAPPTFTVSFIFIFTLGCRESSVLIFKIP